MKMRTQLLLGYAMVFTLMILIAGVMYQSINAMTETQKWVNHTHKVKNEASDLLNKLLDMETGERGYVLTGKEAFLEPYVSGKASLGTAMAELQELVADNPSQVATLKAIAALAEKWQQEVAQPVIETRREMASGADLAEVTAVIEKGTGKTLLDAIRAKVAEFIAAEDSLLAERENSSSEAATQSTWLVIFGTLLAIVIGIVMALFISRSISGNLGRVISVAEAIAEGNLDTIVEEGGGYEIGKLRASVDRMQASLRRAREAAERLSWLKTGVARLNDVMRGDLEIEPLASKVISEVANYLDGQVGAFYVAQNGGKPAFSLVGSYAYTKRKNLSNVFELGDGLVGQAALEKQQILLKNVPEDYIKVTSGLGERVPRFICVTPCIYEDHVKGVVEIGTLNEMTDLELEYLSQAMPALAIAVQSAENRTTLAKSLQESQQLSEELQAQQEELKVANEELEEQTQRLEESEQRLKQQQEELQVTNEELEEKNELLERQKREVELARKDIEEKAEEVALASKYKSEFLANMSHELRTPLNSLLLLSQGLVENKSGNLTADQIESARIIHGGGSDLLSLINEILDLSKIEAGRMDLQLGAVRIGDLTDSFRTSFGHMAKEKGLGLEIVAIENGPPEIVSDRKRLEQVVKNLLSNAIKFTKAGTIRVTFGRPDAGTDLSRSGLSSGDCLAIAVSDTGIGIAPDQHKLIFEAFQQADGGTSRKYGGTGLGLSISRELARLLGGEIRIESEPGKGSTFTLYLPIVRSAERMVPAAAQGTGMRPQTDTGSHRALSMERVAALQIEDDRDSLEKDARAILVIEDDPKFARVLYKKCHEKGFKCLATPTGEAGLELAAKHLPSAVILDIRLPGIDGWAVLAGLKDDIRTRHIPVHVVSVEDASAEALRKGAVGYATKPLAQEGLEETFARIEQLSTGKPRRLLVVEDDADLRQRTVTLIGNGDVKVDEAASGKEALAALRTGRYDCVVLDLGLPDMSGLAVLDTLESEGVKMPPVIIHTARDLTREEEAGLHERAESIVVKDVRSQERLLDEVSLFLHRVVSGMPEDSRQIICNLHDSDELLRDKKVLIVDDDLRTVFAMSQFLSTRGMKPLKAENGEKALRLLAEQPDVDLVLMDIMMPVMDGYEAIARIRAQERFHRLPVIALTAKAMKEDRAKCIAAGANDYLSKPVDQDRLISLMRVWLYR